MKKCFILTIFLLLISSPAFADDDFFDNYTGIDRVWDGQKPITNQEFEKAIDTLQEGQKKKEAKQKKRRIRKISGGGTSLHRGLDPLSDIKEQTPVKQNEEGVLLNIPVNIIAGENILEQGFYNVYGEKDKNGEIFLNFYQ